MWGFFFSEMFECSFMKNTTKIPVVPTISPNTSLITFFSKVRLLFILPISPGIWVLMACLEGLAV
jgi:hypothetical protein